MAIAVYELEYFFHGFRRYEFKSTLSQREFFKKIMRGFRGVWRGSLLGFEVAEDLAISDVARVFGLRTSAIRYYEQIGILPPAMRDGQRRYDDTALFSSRCGAARPRDGIHLGGNTRAIFWVPARDASTETLARSRPTKNRGTTGPDEAA